MALLITMALNGAAYIAANGVAEVGLTFSLKARRRHGDYAKLDVLVMTSGCSGSVVGLHHVRRDFTRRHPHHLRSRLVRKGHCEARNSL
jgi:hypothetical protein